MATMARHLALTLALATLTAVGLAGATAGSAPADTPADTAGEDVLIEVKFDEDLAVRSTGTGTGTGSTLRAAGGQELPRTAELLERHDARALLPFLDGDAARQLRAATREQERRSAGDEALPDLASWYTAVLPAGTDTDAVLAELRALPEVAFAEPAPEQAPPPATPTRPAQPADTPDLTDRQGYFGPASANGIDADYSRGVAGARGEGIKIVDLEYNWNPFHEDLQLDWSTDIGQDRFVRDDTFGDEHGTAVFGQLVADDNAFGVTGGVPDAEIHGISPTEALPTGGTEWRPGPALAFLASLQGDDGGLFMQPGDVVLLEQQGGQVIPDEDCPAQAGSCYSPLEWNAPVHEAIQVLTGLGVTVVATGGNGFNSTDHPAYTRDGQPWFRADNSSGSLLVGAGASTSRERLDFSNHGPRFDVQAWGEGIVTTGYCDLHCDQADHNVSYTASFGGTSGAGPIVTAAVAAIQSYVTSTGQAPLTPDQIRDLLIDTGQPQGPTTTHQHIGPLPNLQAALTTLGAPTQQ